MFCFIYGHVVLYKDIFFLLQSLLLDSNQIEMISDRAFAGLTHLKRLSLNENRLTMLNSGMLDGVPAITFLDLRSNELQTLTYENVRPIIHNLYNETSYFLLESKFLCMLFNPRKPHPCFPGLVKHLSNIKNFFNLKYFLFACSLKNHWSQQGKFELSLMDGE